MNPLKLRKLYHLKRKFILLGMKRQRKMDEIEMQLMREGLTVQEDNIRKECDDKIKDHSKKYEDALSKVRDEEKSYYDPLLKDLKNKLSDMQKEWNDSREYFTAITQYGIKMEETGEQAADQFQRARIKLIECVGYMKSFEKCYQEVIKHIDTGKSKIEYAQITVEKGKEKIFKDIK